MVRLDLSQQPLRTLWPDGFVRVNSKKLNYPNRRRNKDNSNISKHLTLQQLVSSNRGKSFLTKVAR